MLIDGLKLKLTSISFCLIKKKQKIKATKAMLLKAAVASLNPAKLAFHLLLVLGCNGLKHRLYG